MGEIKQILRKKRRFYLFSKVILAVSKVRHLPQLPPLRYGHDIWWYAVPGDDGTIDNCTWNLSLKFIEVRIFCYLMPVIGKNMISWFYAYVDHIEIKTKTVNIIHFPYLDLSQNVKIRDVPYSLKSPRHSECNSMHCYGFLA
jgi:hypothetical protein